MKMLLVYKFATLSLLTCAVVTPCNALQTGSKGFVRSNPQQVSRRDVLATTTTTTLVGLWFGTVMTGATPLIASAEDNIVLSEDEMAARVARKLELQRKARGGGGSSSASSDGGVLGEGIPASAYTANIRSDVNPEAAIDLRSRSFIENTKIAIAKQEEMNKRDKEQKREDLCEMLGRGC